jgi:chromosome segregation ATPase
LWKRRLSANCEEVVSATETPKLLDKQVDRLYGLPLDEFTAARNELAKGLRTSGDREGAEQVRTLEKPTLPAWVANQLVRRHQRDVRALLDAVDELRRAQERALGGAGADDVRAAQEAERGALRSLGEETRELLHEVGRRSPGTVERVVATLRAAAADREARPLLEQGRLTQEVASSGFPELAAAAPAQTTPKRRKTDEAAEARKEARERAKRLQAEVRELRRAVQAADGRLREAEREHARAEREAADARADLERAEAELERARSDATA